MPFILFLDALFNVLYIQRLKKITLTLSVRPITIVIV